MRSGTTGHKKCGVIPAGSNLHQYRLFFSLQSVSIEHAVVGLIHPETNAVLSRAFEIMHPLTLSSYIYTCEVMFYLVQVH